MSLLDDVSIVVTPNGVKASKLYAVIPVPTEGAEEVTNGTFSGSSTGWSESGTWTYGNNNEVCTGNGTNQMLTQSGILTSGKLYTYSIDIISSALSSQEIRVYVGGTDYTTHTLSGVAETISGNTVSSGANLVIRVTSSNTSGVLTIDNVSVKEYTSADMDVTRATAATRVDEDGLVNYAEIVSDTELITNGDFASSTGWSFTNSGGSNGWIIDSGRAICDSSATTPNRNLDSTFSLVNGKSYRLIIDILQSEDNMSIIVGSTQLSETLPTGTHLNYEYFIPESAHSGGTFAIYAGSSDLQEIDNVSVKEVTRDNVPRIDYTGGGCPHILAEPQRINLMLYSEDYSSNWTTSNLSVVEHSTTSPSGETNADKLKEDSSNSAHKIRYASPNTPVTNGAVYTMSFFAKKEERTSIRISNAAMSNTDGKFNLSNGQVISSGSSATNSMVDYGNGWYRCIMTFTSTTTIAQANIAILNANNDITYQGDGSSGLYMWGVQIEAGSYATSYIPNFGTSSGVTRAQDLFTRDGIGSLINSTEGVLFVELENIVDSAAPIAMLGLTDGSASNRISIFISGGQLSAESAGSGTNLGIFSKSLSTGFNKIAIKYKVNDCALWINGDEYNDTSFAAFSVNTLNTLSFDKGDGTMDFYGKVKQLQVYKTADIDLAALTS